MLNINSTDADIFSDPEKNRSAAIPKVKMRPRYVLQGIKHREFWKTVAKKKQAR
jgi:hypothetical protein